MNAFYIIRFINTASYFHMDGKDMKRRLS